jgi:hypothetical protein
VFPLRQPPTSVNAARHRVMFPEPREAKGSEVEDRQRSDGGFILILARLSARPWAIHERPYDRGALPTHRRKDALCRRQGHAEPR